MKATHLFANILIASSLYAVSAQAQNLVPSEQLSPFTVAQATDNTSTSTSTTDGATGTSSTTTTEAPPQTNTQVDVTTQAAPPAQAPDINVDMPDINMPASNAEGGTDTNTTTTTTERLVVDNTNAADPAADNNMLYMGIFGVLAVALIAIIAITMSRRSARPTI